MLVYFSCTSPVTTDGAISRQRHTIFISRNPDVTEPTRDCSNSNAMTTAFWNRSCDQHDAKAVARETVGIEHHMYAVNNLRQEMCAVMPLNLPIRYAGTYK